MLPYHDGVARAVPWTPPLLLLSGSESTPPLLSLVSLIAGSLSTPKYHSTLFRGLFTLLIVQAVRDAMKHFYERASVYFARIRSQSGLGIRSSVFWANHLFFVKKWATWAIRSKKERFAHLLIFGEQPERFAHGHSFLVSDLSESLMVAHFWWATWAIHVLTSLIKKEGMSELLIILNQKTYIKHTKKKILA